MKSGLILILIGTVILMGFNISSLRKELQSAGEHTTRLEERNEKLQRELIRLSRVNEGNEQFLNELEQNIKEFESKLPFSSLKKYIPKPILNDVKPIIEKLQSFQEAREGGISSGEEEAINSLLEGAD